MNAVFGQYDRDDLLLNCRCDDLVETVVAVNECETKLECCQVEAQAVKVVEAVDVVDDAESDVNSVGDCIHDVDVNEFEPVSSEVDDVVVIVGENASMLNDYVDAISEDVGLNDVDYQVSLNSLVCDSVVCDSTDVRLKDVLNIKLLLYEAAYGLESDYVNVCQRFLLNYCSVLFESCVIYVLLFGVKLTFDRGKLIVKNKLVFDRGRLLLNGIVYYDVSV